MEQKEPVVQPSLVSPQEPVRKSWTTSVSVSEIWLCADYILVDVLHLETYLIPMGNLILQFS